MHDDGTDHDHVESGSGVGLDLMAEFNGESRGKTTFAGESEENTGGTILYVSPGLHVSAPGRWGAFASVGIPVLTDFDGIQTDVDFVSSPESG